MKYSDVLEIIILCLLCLMFASWLSNKYVCEVNTDIALDDVNYSSYFVNISPRETKYYSTSETKEILKELEGYDVNVKCNYNFKKK